MDERLNSHDWEEAFACAMRAGIRGVLSYAGGLGRFTREDVAQVLAVANGVNEEDSWVGAFVLRDGRHVLLSAWCSYTGWDSMSGGDAQVASSLEDLVRWAMSNEDRRRLGYSLPEAPNA